MKYHFRPYQTLTVEKIIRNFRMNESKSLVHLFTGAGKTLIFSKLVADAERILPSVRVLIIVPKNILVEQTYLKLINFVDAAKVSFYNAGLGIKNINAQYVIGSIQSVVKLDVLPKFNIVVCDECHIVAKSHIKVWDKIQSVNPKAKLVGFTATPAEKIDFWPNTIISRDLKWATPKYATPLSMQSGNEDTRIDLSNVKVRMGEYVTKDLEAVVNEKIESQVADALGKSKHRKKVAWICLSIEHAEKVASLIPDAVIIHSKLNKKIRNYNIKTFENTSCRNMVSVMQVSLGYDYPALDCIVLMRPTRSKQLFIQAVGRGVRPFKGKKDCLLLDYGRIIENLGSPYDVKFDGKPSKPKQLQLCPMCDNFSPAEAKKCHICQFHFKIMCKYCGEMHDKGTSCNCGLNPKITWRNSIKNLTDKAYNNKYIYEFSTIALRSHISKAGNKCKILSYGLVHKEYFMAWNEKKLEKILNGLNAENIGLDQSYKLDHNYKITLIKNGKYYETLQIERSDRVNEQDFFDHPFA